MTRRRDQVGGAESDVPQEYADLAQRLSAHLTAPTFDPAVKAQQLYRLRALAAAQPAPVIERRRPRVLRWGGLGRRVIGTAAASLAVLTLSTSAVAAASSDALPGEALYGTKLLVGRVRLAAAVSDEAKVAVLMDQAQRRLDEIDALRERGADPALLDQALESFRAHVQDAEVVAGDDEQLQRRVMKEAREDSARLQELPAPSDPEAQRILRDALQQASSAARDASGPSEQRDEPEAPEGPAPEPGPAPSSEPGDEGADPGPDENPSPPADPGDESPAEPAPPAPPEPKDSEPPPAPDPPADYSEPDAETNALELNSASDARSADEASEVKTEDKEDKEEEEEDKKEEEAGGERDKDKDEPVRPPEQPSPSS